MELILKVYVWVGFIEHVYVHIRMQALLICPALYVAIMSTRMYGRRRGEGDNDFDRYAVAVLRRGVVVGHYLDFR